MSAKSSIKPGEFAKTLNDIMDQYGDEIVEISKRESEESAKETAKLVKQYARSSGIGDVSGRTSYVNQTFKVTKTDEGRLNVTFSVHSPKYYRVAHLLEYGHPKVIFGTRTGGTVKAFPHWAQAEAEGVKLYEERVEKAIKEASK